MVLKQKGELSLDLGVLDTKKSYDIFFYDFPSTWLGDASLKLGKAGTYEVSIYGTCDSASVNAHNSINFRIGSSTTQPSTSLYKITFPLPQVPDTTGPAPLYNYKGFIKVPNDGYYLHWDVPTNCIMRGSVVATRIGD